MQNKKLLEYANHDERKSLCESIQLLQKSGESLQKQIQTMNKDRTMVRGVAHQIARGSAELRALQELINKLGREKQNLQLHVQLIHAGFTQRLHEAIEINTTAVAQLDKLVKNALGHRHSLAIAAFVRNKVNEGHEIRDGYLLLSIDEFEKFKVESESRFPKKAAAEPPRAVMRERIIQNCQSNDTAVQLNCPIGPDQSKHINRLVIKDCTARGNSIQSNHPQSLEAFEMLLNKWSAPR